MTEFGFAAKTENSAAVAPDADAGLKAIFSAESVVLKELRKANLPSNDDASGSHRHSVLFNLPILLVQAQRLDAPPEDAKAPPPENTLHSKDDVLEQLSPRDRDKLELLIVERAAASAPEEIDNKDSQIKNFIRAQLGNAVSEKGIDSLLSPLTLEEALTRLNGKATADGKPFVEYFHETLWSRAFSAIGNPFTDQGKARIKEIQENLAKFRLRAKDQGLSDECVSATLINIARVLDPSTSTKHGDRLLVARGILRNASDPTAIDQGGHNTCNVTTLECRLYTREPDTAAKLVADVAINGQFRTADGTIVTPRCLRPDGEALADPTPDGARNYASQLFQITAINVHWNRKDTLPGGKFAGIGNIHYCQGEPGQPSEFLLNCSKNPPEIHSFETLDASHPWLDLAAISEINEQITGKPSKNFGIERWFVSGEDRGCFRVSSLQEFKARLNSMAAENAFPVVLVVDAAKKPIGSGNGGFGLHVVTITHYDPVTGMVTLDNQWGKGNDMTGAPGQRAPVNAADLFDSMNQFPSADFFLDHIKRNIKGIGPNDAVKPGIAALSARGLRWAASSHASALLHTGLERMHARGIPGAAAVLGASETRFGRISMRTGTALTAVGLAVAANDIRAAFKEGTAHGVGKVGRLGVNSLTFELGGLAGLGLGRVTLINRWAPGRAGMLIGAGLLTAAVVDRVAGESVELGTSYLYEKARERVNGWLHR